DGGFVKRRQGGRAARTGDVVFLPPCRHAALFFPPPLPPSDSGANSTPPLRHLSLRRLWAICAVCVSFRAFLSFWSAPRSCSSDSRGRSALNRRPPPVSSGASCPIRTARRSTVRR